MAEVTYNFCYEPIGRCIGQRSMQNGIETQPKDACLQSWASDLHFHWELRVFADPLPFPLQLLDPKVMVIDSRAICLKVRERSDRRGKLPAWPSDATTMIRQIRHEI